MVDGKPEFLGLFQTEEAAKEDLKIVAENNPVVGTFSL